MKNLNGLIGLPGPVATKICMRCILENWVRTKECACNVQMLLKKANLQGMHGILN